MGPLPDRFGCRYLIAAMVLALGSALVVACGGPSPSPTPPDHSHDATTPAVTQGGTGVGFRLYVLKQHTDDLDLGLTVESSWSILSSLDLSSPLVVFRSEDIATFEWGSQSLLLSEAASGQLRSLTPLVAPDVALNDHVFLVTLDDARLYGGIVEYPEEARLVDYPVIHVVPAVPQVWLDIRPHSGPNVYGADPPQMRSRIEKAELRSYFESLGKLS
jgi:hypothetical protein